MIRILSLDLAESRGVEMPMSLWNLADVPKNFTSIYLTSCNLTLLCPNLTQATYDKMSLRILKCKQPLWSDPNLIQSDRISVGSVGHFNILHSVSVLLVVGFPLRRIRRFHDLLIMEIPTSEKTAFLLKLWTSVLWISPNSWVAHRTAHGGKLGRLNLFVVAKTILTYL